MGTGGYKIDWRFRIVHKFTWPCSVAAAMDFTRFFHLMGILVDI